MFIDFQQRKEETGRQAGRQADRQTDRHPSVASHMGPD